jgi:hypothetical protein
MNCSNEKSGCTTTRCFKIALMVAVGIAALGGVVMLLWNWLMPALFAGAREIDYWQALGVLLLSRILFGGGHGRWRGHRRHLESMTPEEREQLKNRFMGRWGHCRGSDKAEAKATDGPAPHGE